MGIVDLNGDVFVELAQIVTQFFLFPNNILSSIAHHEILLVDTQEFAVVIGVVRIEEQGQVFGNVLFIEVYTIGDNGWIYGREIK